MKKNWKKTYLGNLLSTDPIMGRVVSFILVVYLCIHIFKLEMYPLYMFAMFSKKETPKEFYHTYKLFNKDKVLNLENWDYRKYTVVMNTIDQYDGILENNMSHPESKVIDKFIDRLHLNESVIKTKLKGSFSFSKEELKSNLGIWLGNILEIAPADLRIVKESYKWEKSPPHLVNTSTIYYVD